MLTSTPISFVVVVPVKPVSRAKSRLGPLGGPARRRLVAAFAADTVVAALASPVVDSVVVVADDPAFEQVLSREGVEVVPDRGHGDLNSSLACGVAEAAHRRPDRAVAALCADLPALRTTELTAALEVASHHEGSFVADRTGVGTTMVTALRAGSFLSRFGRESTEKHRRAGLHEIVEVAVPTLRQDVDTPEDLVAALGLGVGSQTAHAVRGIRL